MRSIVEDLSVTEESHITYLEASDRSSKEITSNFQTSFQIVAGHDGVPQPLSWCQVEEITILSVFVLRGSAVLLADGAQQFAINAGQHIMCRVKVTSKVTMVSSDALGFYAVTFQCGDEYLQRYYPDNCPKLYDLLWAPMLQNIQYLSSRGKAVTTQPAERLIISQIMDAEHLNHIQTVYRKIKIVELFVLQLEEIMNEVNEIKETQLLEHELQRVYRVRDILRANLSKTHTLLGLAHEVGTNDATLKKHFKQVMGQTVFAYLTSCRMEVARDLLVAEHRTVTEVAHYLGYKHISHFSSAFRKYHGCSPSKFPGVI